MTSAPLLLVASLVAAADPGPKPIDAVVAEGEGFRITAAEFEARMKEQSPLTRASYGTLGRKREFLDQLVKFKLLLTEARRRGLDRDPDVVNALEKLMVQRLVQLQFLGAGETPPSEAELRSAYEAQKDQYRRPAKVRVVLRHFPVKAGARDRAQVEKEANELHARLESPMPAEAAGNEQANEADTPEESPPEAHFGALAQLSDEGFLTREEVASRHGQKVADAAFALRDGELAPVVATEEGFYVLKVVGRQEGFERSFEEVKGQLGAKLGREARTKAFDEMVRRLRSQARVRIDDAALERIVVK